MAARLAAVFGLAALLCARAAAGKLSIPLRQTEPSGYYAGEIGVGTPAQRIASVVFMTTFSDLWLNLRSARRHRNASHFYDPGASSTYSRADTNFEMMDVSGHVMVSGFVAKDDMRIGDLSVKDFAFGAVAHGIATDELDGLVGLTMRRTQLHTGTPTILDRLAKDGQLEQSVFAIYLNDHRGELTFGGINADHADGDFHFVDVNSDEAWQVPLGDVLVGNVSVHKAPSAVVAPDVKGLAIPRHDVEDIARRLGVLTDRYGHLSSFFDVNCSAEVPRLSFVIGGREYSLGKEDLVTSYHNQFWHETRCHLELDAGANASTWVLGQAFMRKYYVQYDYGQRRLGFVPARRGVDDNFV